MAPKSNLRSVLLWAASVSPALTYSVAIPSGLSSHIPPCSRSCVKSFLEAQFSEYLCSSTPTLACLCAHRSTSSYTIGEAAVQCMIAANRAGLCPDTVLDADVINGAYLMCDGVPEALPNTHATLSATIVFPSSGSGIIIIETPSPVATTTSQPTTQTSTRPAPSTTATQASSTTFLSSTLATTTTSAGTTRNSITSTTASSTSISTTTSADPPIAEQTDDPTSTITLENGQIAGISMGIASAIAIALIAIFIARRKRKKNFPDFDDGDWTQENGEKEDNMVDRVSRIFHISPPIFRFSRPLNTQQTYEGYQNIDRNTIGIAISRPRSTGPSRLSKQNPVTSPNPGPPLRDAVPALMTTAIPASNARPTKAPAERPTSKLLPAKPNLTLAIPPPAATRTTSSQPPLTDRTSTLTNNTAFADLDSAALEGTTWRPPPSDPQSATAVYVADRWGNWVLSTKANNEPNFQQGPAVPPIPRAAGSGYDNVTRIQSPRRGEPLSRGTSQAVARNSPQGLPARPPPAFLLIDPSNNSVIRASSVYSQASAPRQPPARPPYPPASRSNSSSNKGSKGRNGRSNSEVSNNSVTTIDTEFESPFDDEEASAAANNNVEAREGHLSNLSPVAERRSPSPMPSPPRPDNDNNNGARSPPPGYPRYQGRLEAGATVRLVPPPRRPEFGMSSNSSNSRSPPPPSSAQRSPEYPSVMARSRPRLAPRPGPGPVPDTPGAYPEPLRPVRRSASRPGEQTRLSMGSLQQQPPRFFPQPQQQYLQQQQLRMSPVLQQQQQQQPIQPLLLQQQQQQRQQTRQQLQPPRLDTRFDDPGRYPPRSPTPQQQQQQQHQQQQLLHPPPSLSGDPAAAATTPQQIRSPRSALTTSSTTSSLLAKRVGSDKAAALALDPNAPARGHPPWRRQGGDSHNQAAGGGGGAGTDSQDGGSLLSPDAASATAAAAASLASPYGTGVLPMTPGWRPRLTPTRRGDDLYLNVQ